MLDRLLTPAYMACSDAPSRRLSAVYRAVAAAPVPAAASAGGFILIAHRGGQDEHAENTMEAFRDSVARLHCPNVEFDVQLSSDGAPIIIHDHTLARTAAAGVDGKVAEMSWAELRKVKLDGGGSIPRLEPFLTEFKGRAHLHLELKSKQLGLVRTVCAALRNTGWLDRPSSVYEMGGVTIFCQDLEQLEEVKQHAPESARMWAVGAMGITDDTIATALASGLDGLCVMSTFEDLAAMVARAHAAGLRVRCSTIGEPNDEGYRRLRRCVEAGADGTTIDWPLRAQVMLGSLAA